jgi:hypothetical protein
MLVLNRGFCRLDAGLRRGDWESQWAIGTVPPAPWPELAGKTLIAENIRPTGHGEPPVNLISPTE